jgi:hypothetical protein
MDFPMIQSGIPISFKPLKIDDGRGTFRVPYIKPGLKTVPESGKESFTASSVLRFPLKYLFIF